MADVFISYARADQPVSAALCKLLESEGWDVWFDQELRAGERWERSLLGVLQEAKVVVVLWSAHALKSPWVAREAELALEADKLVPVVIDDTMPVAPFDAVEAALLRGWSGEPEHPELHVLFAGLEAHARPSRIDTVRPGYDDSFLDTKIDLPDIPGTGDEFPYLHFSVIMNPARRLAWYVAYNVRERCPESRRSDKWLPDPTLPRAFQPGDEHYRRSEFDRGHLVSPATVAWGEPRRAQIAMDQSFFWTNTSPQSPAFNQKSWLRLEVREREIAKERGGAVGFSGPLFAADDREYRGTDELRGRLRAYRTFLVPRRYFKLVVAPGPGGALEVSAHCVENSTEPVSPVAVGLDDLEALTGLHFPPALHEAAPLVMPAHG
jgi:DNA/RNA endonuclease G (NUC1)